MATLPEDAVIEILSKLPAESVLRFKSVCKSWYALINHPNFVRKHFSNSLHHNHILLKRVMTKNTGENENIISILKLIIFSFDVSESVLDFDFPSDEDFPHFEICGHSHGLICLADIRKDIFLCNPTTREFRKLPPSILRLIEPPEEPGACNLYTNAVGFGYDPKSKDFKVVRVVHFVKGSAYFHCLRRVEIYDLSKDRWREIETPVYGYVIRTPSFEIYNQGTYYWWARDVGGARIIQSFDMSEEVFGRISVPEVLEANLEKYISSMGVLNGSFVLFHYPWSGNKKTFDIWEMEKDGSGGVSWSKVLTIGPVSGIEMAWLFVSSDEFLMEGKEGQVIVYNIRTQQLKELPIKGPRGHFRATCLIKSLVSVKGGSNIRDGF